MCGIAGHIGFYQLDEQKVSRALTTMERRGPDAQRCLRLNDQNVFIDLLHSRLSIIDLDSRSNQPYVFENLSMAFNGEIYNYIEVKKQLVNQGYFFNTTGDTEVLIKAFHAWGLDAFKKLEGMWATAVYDKSEKKLYLSRDRFAEKPLFYYLTAHGVFFGSEIKAIKALVSQKIDINENQIYRYLTNGYKSLYKNDETFYKGIQEVNLASVLTVDYDLAIEQKKYWKPQPRVNEKMRLDEAIEGVRERLIKSVKLRMRSDVPLAFCLSGGIDSASLASIAAKEFNYNVNTFSIIDEDERYNEYDNIKATVDDIDCKPTFIKLEPKNMLTRLQKLVAYHDGPVATISYLVHSMLSEQIAERGFKVAISGTAADELLTGYYDHFNLHLYELKNSKLYETRLKEWKQHLAPIVRNPHLKNPELYVENAKFRDHIYLNQEQFETTLLNTFHEDFIEEYYCDNLLKNRMLNELFHEGSRVILHEDDLNSMFYSIENRSPFLDTELFDFSYSIPVKHLINDGYAKYILREAMRGILNDKVRLDRHKKGFNASINSLIDFKNKKDRAIILDDSPIFSMVHKEKIEKILEQDKLTNSYSKYLFNFLNVKMFLEDNE